MRASPPRNVVITPLDFPLFPYWIVRFHWIRRDTSVYVHAFARTNRFRSALGKVIVKSGSRERESFPIKMDYEEEPIENRNCNFITGERRKERKKRRKEKYFPKGNSVERFAIVVAHCRFIVAYWIVESIQNFTLFLSLSLYTVVILNRTRREKRFESYI